MYVFAYIFTENIFLHYGTELLQNCMICFINNSVLMSLSFINITM